MRKISFRGFRKDGKGWVYGDLLKQTERTWIVSKIIINNKKLDISYHEVVPKSVGQAANEQDIKNREVYEGDIAKGFYKQYTMNVDGWGRDLPRCSKHSKQEKPKLTSDIHIVEFCKNKICLQRTPCPGEFDFHYFEKIEIIGTVFENPELLKGK